MFVLVQLNMLLCGLYGEPVGFTVLGIFVIDRNTVLTVGDYRSRRQLQLVCSNMWCEKTSKIVQLNC